MIDAAIGIDIGGTSTKLGLVTQAGEVLGKQSIDTQAYHSQEEYLGGISKAILQLLAMSLNCHIRLKGVGIGSPSGNFHTGIIAQCANIEWAKDLDIVGFLKKELRCPVALTNDANAAALAEKYYGKAKNLNHFATITLGTGLGCGIFSEGNIVHGAFGFAGEIGHSVVKFNGRPCGCGNQGCLETYVSATGVKTTYLKLLKINSDYMNSELSNITAAQIAELALQGDVTAISTFEYTGKLLGWKLADLVNHTEPDTIFLVGGLANAGALLFDPCKKHLDNYLLPMHKGKIKLSESQLKNDEAGMLGAASLVWHQGRFNTTSITKKVPEQFTNAAS